MFLSCRTNACITFECVWVHLSVPVPFLSVWLAWQQWLSYVPTASSSSPLWSQPVGPGLLYRPSAAYKHKDKYKWKQISPHAWEHYKVSDVKLTCIHQWSWHWCSRILPLLWLAADTHAWSRRAWCSPAGFWTCCTADWHSQTVMCGPWHWPDAEI